MVHIGRGIKHSVGGIHTGNNCLKNVVLEN